ncbi:MAG: methyltransferase [Burkholderiaceae bacterium]
MSEPSPVLVHWEYEGSPVSACWRSESGAQPPRRMQVVNDELTADRAFRMASEGTGLIWTGDFQNARQLLQAVTRRLDRSAQARRTKARKRQEQPPEAVERFNQMRVARAQRARTLGLLLVPLQADYNIELRRAPDVAQACEQAWGPAPLDEAGEPLLTLVSLRELLGVMGAFEWRLKGVEVALLGGPYNRIHPHYGVFSPVRGEYLELVAAAPLPSQTGQPRRAFDIGTGTGVIAALLARRGIETVIATERDPRAVKCAQENFARLGVSEHVQLQQTELFPEGRADLIVCNPPWIPARPAMPIERAIYDERSAMLSAFLEGLVEHLEPGGEAWLVMSDIAERLGLRSREDLMNKIESAGLVAAGKADIRPQHPKTQDPEDPLHEARVSEVTSLWRLLAR